MPENLLPKLGEGGLFWRKQVAMTGASPEAQWLAERLASAGYVVVVVSASYGSQEAMWSYAFLHALLNRGGGVLCRWRHTLLVAVAEVKREVSANCEEV